MYDDKDPMLQSTEIKLYNNGLSTNITAAVIEPYLIDHGMGMRSTAGLNYCEQDKMAHYITELEKVGFNFNIHVIGGIAVHESLNATEIAQQKNDLPNSPRHHLIHIPYVTIDNIQRFSELDVIADVQMAGDWILGEQPFDGELLGHGRVSNATPMSEIIDAGARYTLPSDWDVSSLNTFVGMRNVMLRGR
ncbi:MAG: putative amidohydrolase YtcJ [Chitinophagales bacterium]|jgi:predicted amidohydrolase YtcJ